MFAVALVPTTEPTHLPPDLHATLQGLDLEAFTPDDMAELIKKARQRGHRIERHPIILAAVAQFLDDFQRRAGRYAEGTIARMMIGWERFVGWCLANDDRSSLPAEVATVEAYLQARAGSVHRNTLALERWAIGAVHKAAGYPNPAADDRVKGTMEAIVRAKVRAEETIDQAAALRETHLDDLVQLWGNSPLLLRKRDLAMMVVGYETMLRAAELARVRCQHLELNPDGTAVLTIPITKVNQSGLPDTSYLSRQAVRLVLDYLEAAGRQLTGPAPLFGKVTKHNKPAYVTAPLSVDTVENVFARAWSELGLERQGIPCWTGHSARVGAAQDLAAGGASLVEIMQAGRWSSVQMVLRYCRGILAGESAMAKRRAGKR